MELLFTLKTLFLDVRYRYSYMEDKLCSLMFLFIAAFFEFFIETS